MNKQINDKERVAAALENPNLMKIVEKCIADRDYWYLKGYIWLIYQLLDKRLMKSQTGIERWDFEFISNWNHQCLPDSKLEKFFV